MGGFSMIQVTNLSLRIGKRALFEDVNIKFTEGNCYGVIGANGAGKSTFLKILSGEIDSTTGTISMNQGERLSFLRQDHFQFDNESVLDTVIMGNPKLYAIGKEKDLLYMKADFTDVDGIRAAELEADFAQLGGWEAEGEVAELLIGLGLSQDIIDKQMQELDLSEKVKVLLAQALFGNPDVLLLDEPTNHLDLQAIQWLEEFLINFENTVIVVSHDRHFLNQVCTHIADIDYSKITLFTGNYDFWYESSQLILRQMKESNRKKEDKIKELQDFIARFSANASKSRQATSRKKALEKIEIEDMKASSRKYPYVHFKINRDIGNDVLRVDNLSIIEDNVKLLDNVSFRIEREDKVLFLAEDEKAISLLMEVLYGAREADLGTYKWGTTTSQAYFPKQHNHLFESQDNLIDWLWQFTDSRDETYIRGFLGRMLFSGEEALKPVHVLSGGEKVRCLLSMMMLQEANILLMDDPTNHLDMESIQALNDALIQFKGVVLFSSHDQQFVQTIANRIMVIDGNGKIKDYQMPYDEFLSKNKEQLQKVYAFEGEAD